MGPLTTDSLYSAHDKEGKLDWPMSTLNHRREENNPSTLDPI